MAQRREKATPRLNPRFPLLLGLLFFISGAAALIDEVVWTRWQTLALGSSNRAVLLVLGTFMGGLGIGAWLGGRLADRQRQRTLALFAWAELILGAWSFLAIFLMGRWLPELAGGLAHLLGLPALPDVLRVLLALLTLAPATVLMGATLPILSRYVADRGLLPGRGFGWLYAANTFGGTAGVFLATFLLIESIGLTGTALVAGVADLGAGGMALWWSRRAPVPRMLSSRQETSPVPEVAGERARRLFVAACLGFLLSGFAGMALETVFHRILAIVSGSSVYAFSVMLGAFLFGTAVGSATGTNLVTRVRRPDHALALALGTLALGLGIAQRALTPGGLTTIHRLGGSLPFFSDWSYGLDLFVCLMALLPATIALGFVVPFVGRIAAVASDQLGRRIGVAYALNTVGSVGGTLAGGVLLIPWLGTAGATQVVLLLVALAGMGLAGMSLAGPRRWQPIAAALLLVAAGGWFGFGADPARTAMTNQLPGSRLLDFIEGSVQTIAVAAYDNEQQLAHLRLLTNRTTLTGTQLYAQRYMRLLGLLPALWAESPKRGLVICLGTGMTAGALAAHPELDRLDIAEISPEVVDVNPYFRPVNGDVLANRRTVLHIEDGRHVLLAASEPWDVITLEPPPPRDSGVVSLYTEDFYQLCRRRLTPGGVVAQWIPLHSESMEEIRILLRSFLNVFPEALGFMPVERELLLLGSVRPLRIDPEKLAHAWSLPAVRSTLEAIGFEGPAPLLATACFDRPRLERLAAGAPGLTDDLPRTEYFLRFGKTPAFPNLLPWLEDWAPLEALLSRPAEGELARAFAVNRRARLTLMQSWYLRDRPDIDVWAMALQAIALRPADPYLLWVTGLSDEHLARMRQRAEAPDANPGQWVDLAQRWTDRGRTDEAERVLAAGAARFPQLRTLAEKPPPPEK